MKTKFLKRVLWLLIPLLTMFSIDAWGATITLTTTSLSTPSGYNNGQEYDATVSNVTFNYVYLMTGTGGNAGKIQSQASNGELWNSTLVPGKITNVSATHSGTARSSNLYWGTSAKATTNSSSVSGSFSKDSPSGCFGYIHIKRSSNAAYWSQVVITYTPATITLSKSSITGLDYNLGSGPSASQTFTVSGSNIPANLTVTAPTNFEVSLDGSSWGSSKTISVTLTGPSGGTLSATTVYVRLASGKSAGNYSGNVSIAMAGCNTISGVNPKTVAVSGTVSAASCSTNATVSAGSLKGSVSSSSEATAQCTGGITSLGSAGCSITSYGFAVGTSTNPTIGGTLTGTGKTYQVGTTYTTTSTAFEKLIDGLSASTKYYVRPYATNGNGTAYGSEFNFTTLAACTAAPTVTAGSTGTITKNTAVVNCTSGITSLGTGGCAITSYGFAYGTSANPTISGTKSVVGTEYTSTGTSFTATLTGLTEGQTYYVRPYATNGFGTAYGDQVTFGTPKITVVPAGLVVAFGDKKVGGTYTETFTVSGVNLQGNITLTPSAGCSGIFSIDKTSITPTSGSVTNEVITITYTPTTAGSHGGGSVYINIESSNAQTRSVMPTGTGKWEVTWSNNGVTSTTLVANSAKPEFPSAPSSCDGTSTTFIGWATAPWTGKIASLAGKTVHTAASTMDAVTANGTTYYAVFAKAGESTTTFKRVQTLSDLNTASKIAIVNAYSKSNYILTTDLATAQTAPTENGSGQISVSSGQYWTLEKSSTNWKFKKDATNYLKGDANPTSSEKQKTISTGTSGNMTWVITTNSHTGNGTPVFTIRNASSDYAGLEYSSGWCLYYGTDFNTSWYTLKLYVPDAVYSDYLTTCCAKNVALSASATNGTVAFTVSSSPVTSIATCSEDKEVTMTITPAAGYKLTAYSSNTGTVSPSNTDPAVATSGASSKSAQEITLTFDENANGTCTIATTFTAMKDTYKDQLHGDVNTTFDGDGKEYSATYTVPNLTNPSKGSGDCESEHYKFVGWVESSYVKSDGTLNSGYTLYTAGSSGTASEKTYIAIWAKEL